MFHFNCKLKKNALSVVSQKERFFYSRVLVPGHPDLTPCFFISD